MRTEPRLIASGQAFEVFDSAGRLACGRDGDRLLHLDLHPESVILSPAGPAVIDWTNARRGEPAFDVALTWVISATSAGGDRLDLAFTRRFLSHFDRPDLVRTLAAAAEYRTRDRNVTEDERRAVDALVAAELD